MQFLLEIAKGLLGLIKGIFALAGFYLLFAPIFLCQYIYKHLEYNLLTIIATFFTTLAIGFFFAWKNQKKEREEELKFIRWWIKERGIKIPVSEDDVTEIVENHVIIDCQKYDKYLDVRNKFRNLFVKIRDN